MTTTIPLTLKATLAGRTYWKSSRNKCIGCWSKRTLILGTPFLLLAISAIVLYFVFQSEIQGYTDDYVEFMKKNKAVGILIFAVVYTLSMPAWIPASIFLLCGAYVFGRVFGFGPGFAIFWWVDYAWMQVGSLLAFWNGRYLFSSCVQTCIESRPKMKAISQALSFNAKKLVALMRICAITPYFILNNICAVTKMSTVDYIIGNLPIIVADVPYIWVCASISDVSKVTDSNPLGVWYYVLLAVGLMIILIVIVLIYIFAKKEFNKTMANIKKQQEEEENRENQSNSINHRSDRPIEDI